MRVIRIKRICQIPSFHVVTLIFFVFVLFVLFLCVLVLTRKNAMANERDWFYVRVYLWMEKKIVLSSHREISANESIQSHYYLCVHGRLILFVWGVAIINSKPFRTRNKSQNKQKYFKRIN